MATDPNVSVLAAGPPITVGELVDVPAPNSPINAQFHQEIANRVVQRFPTVAARDAWAAADGSLAYVTATKNHYRRVNGAWIGVDWQTFASTIGGDWQLSGGVKTVNLRWFRSGNLVTVDLATPALEWAGKDPPTSLTFTLPTATFHTGYTAGMVNNAGSIVPIWWVAEGTVLTPLTITSGLFGKYAILDYAGISTADDWHIAMARVLITYAVA